MADSTFPLGGPSLKNPLVSSGNYSIPTSPRHNMTTKVGSYTEAGKMLTVKNIFRYCLEGQRPNSGEGTRRWWWRLGSGSGMGRGERF
ncbi:hypothetical protein J1N35_014332 [Gossypium stocksii]|uniref:Uncharacterized protein n=1 Tax=Gossypium stocksii TaxID=47602 RepID=A0A9D3VWB6_9ROSI|nr:hypothetical protein J1N35_014332 [Gossypium stocksii]